MHLDASPDLAHIVANPARVADLRSEDVPALLGALEELRAALWAHMLRAAAPVARDPTGRTGEQLLTVAEVATELKFTRGYVYDAVRCGQLSAVRTGKYVRIRRAALTAWLDGRPAITLDGHGVPSDSVGLTAPGRTRSVSRRTHPAQPGRGGMTKSPGARGLEAPAATAQRTDD
jgi:excisionase family DNA binding protein